MKQSLRVVSGFIVFIIVAVLGITDCGGTGAVPDGGTPDASTDLCQNPSYLQCNGTCIDVQGDSQNCGACGKVCPNDQVCTHATCAVVCGGGTSRCGNNCVDLKSDPQHCGGCNTACSTGQVCNKAACALTCQAGLTNCGGACVDTTSDDANCNGCGLACADGQYCINSTCQATCSAPWTSCPAGDGGSICVDTSNDPQHCGGCDSTTHACQPGYFCSNGKCGIQCAGGTTYCSNVNACIDETIDPNHCGSCTTACTTASPICNGSHCCPTSTPYYCGGCDTFANCVQKSGGHISAGYEHTCALNPSGAVYCWGENYDGQIGNSSTTYEFNTPQAVTTLTSGVASVACGGYHSCAVTTTGQPYCWGNDYEGQLGNSTTGITEDAPVTVSNISTTGLRVAGSQEASCFLLSSGAVDCAGNEYYGELGNGVTSTFTYISAPAASKITSGAISIGAAGIGEVQCAVMATGSVQCWGDNYYGLGDGTSTFTGTPITVKTVSSAVAVSPGSMHSCAVTSGGSLYCWGYNYYGELGNGGSANSSTPVLATVTGVVAVSVGYYHTCVVTTSGAVECVGYNAEGQLGNGTTSFSPTTTWQTAISSGAIGIAAGGYHTCALLTTGHAECWGENSYGQLGDGSYTQRTSPVLVSGF